MLKKRESGFTLIELLAVLTILAIISLITVPLVINIIASSRENSYVNSIQAYGKAVENAMAERRTETNEESTSIKQLEGYIQTSGNRVNCYDEIDKTDGIKLVNCQVVDDNNQPKSTKMYTYHNGKVTEEAEEDRYMGIIKNYGKAVELAVARYKSEYDDTPYTVQELIDLALFIYSGEANGDTVKCDDKIHYNGEEHQLQLFNCRVFDKDGKPKNEYKFMFLDGVIEMDTDEDHTYNLGDAYELYGEEYYVVSSNDEYVTLLKGKPLTIAEVEKYGQGHINRYTYDSVGKVYNVNNTGYGGIAYYSSEKCGYTKPGDNNLPTYENCTGEYDKSEVKYVVDAWANDKFKNNELATDEDGYRARLLDMILFHMADGYCKRWDTYSACPELADSVKWIGNNNYDYYLMTPHPYNPLHLIRLIGNQSMRENSMFDYDAVIRPVINVYKSALN